MLTVGYEYGEVYVNEEVVVVEGRKESLLHGKPLRWIL